MSNSLTDDVTQTEDADSEADEVLTLQPSDVGTCESVIPVDEPTTGRHHHYNICRSTFAIRDDLYSHVKVDPESLGCNSSYTRPNQLARLKRHACDQDILLDMDCQSESSQEHTTLVSTAIDDKLSTADVQPSFTSTVTSSELSDNDLLSLSVAELNYRLKSVSASERLRLKKRRRTLQKARYQKVYYKCRSLGKFVLQHSNNAPDAEVKVSAVLCNILQPAISNALLLPFSS